jgi:hypothetical protein|tara:strand:+ start:4326 stop:4706 length:381 start_codon:yes stop_codon:yes gene_type:complete
MSSNHQIPDDLLNDEFDFGFTAADEDELNSLIQLDDQTTPDEIKEMQDKLDLILQINSTCEGTTEVKEQYDQLLQLKMDEIEKVTLPLLVNLKKNKQKDYLYWPGSQRETQCDLQIQKLLNITRSV